MKLLILSLALCLGSFGHGASTMVDGSWFDSGCFGCPGDKVVVEVLQQQADYDEAEQTLEGDRTDENLVAAMNLALFSYLKAGHALELGDRARKVGDKVEATKWYNECLKHAAAAKAMPLNEDFKGRKGQNVPKQSRKEGAMWEKLANAGLEKLK